jgi:hypothetical protein
MVYRDVLIPFSHGHDAHYHRWDWDTSSYSERVRVPAHTPLRSEGCGALRRNARLFSVDTIWLEAPEEIRLARALERDGDHFAGAWKRWAIQEERFLELHQSVQLAETLYYTG